jgi:hypothetical protein
MTFGMFATLVFLATFTAFQIDLGLPGIIDL